MSNRPMVETVEAFDARAGIDVDAFLAFAARVAAMTGRTGPGGVLGTGSLSEEDAAKLRREFERADARPSWEVGTTAGSTLRVVLTAQTTMRGRLRRLTARVEAS